MIGQKSFEINARNFMAGMGSSQNANDGGYAPSGLISGTTFESLGNFTVNPGIYYPPGPVTDKTISDVTGLFISSAPDPNISGYEKVFVSDDAKFYSWSGSALTLKHTDVTAGRNYIFGKTDMVAFGFSIFTTSSGSGTGLSRWQTSSDTFTDNFFAFSDTVAPHPALLYENNAYYGDGNLLLRQTDAASAPTVILTLDDAYVIQALGIDPGTGKMLISITLSWNYSDSVNAPSRVGYYDGFSDKLSRIVNVDDMITAFYPCGGTVYVGYGTKLGYWTGAGIEFLRTLNISFTGTELVYKPHFTNIDRTLIVVERRNLLAYGEIEPNKRVFYYILKNNNGASGNYSLATNIGSGKIALSFASAQFATFDTTSISAVTNGGAVLWTNRYEFPRPVTFDQVVVEFYDGTTLPVNDNLITGILYTDGATQTSPITLGTISTGASNNPNVVPLPWPSVETRSMQFRFTMGPPVSGTYGIRRFTVFYTPKD